MLRINALPTANVRALQSGAPDCHGQIPERHISDGKGNPCRHCLRHIPAGEDMLVLAYRPFPDLNPYAEAGPIFLCANPCERFQDAGDLPEVLQSSPDYLIKGYSSDHRIVYGTGTVVPQNQMMAQARAIFSDSRVAYVHVRSARNNCYQARIDRAQPESPE